MITRLGDTSELDAQMIAYADANPISLAPVSDTELLQASATAANTMGSGPSLSDITGGAVGGSLGSQIGNALSSLFGGSGVSNPKLIQSPSATTSFINPFSGKPVSMDTSSVTIYALFGVMGIILVSSLMGGRGRR